LKYKRRLPLVGNGEIETAISIYVRNGNTAAYHGVAETDLGTDVLEPAGPVTYEERERIVTTKIISGTEAGPEVRIGHQLVITRSQ